MSKKDAPEFDINKVAAEFVKSNLESFVNLGAGLFTSATHKFQLHLDRTYNSYLRCLADKCSKTKSFFIRGEPAYLYQFYVPLSVRCGNTDIKGVGFQQIPRCSIIVASGGSGKSMLMKHLVLSAILQKGKVPLFIQLERLNREDIDLLGLVKKTLAENKFRLGEEYIDRAIKAGHFILFLDGLDEVIESKRKDVGRYIREFAQTQDGNSVVVSSRHDPELEGWQEFTVLKVLPLTVDLACDLVAKLPYDEELKEKFLQDLRSKLFEKHKSFLSNPLLLSIMLLTYGQSANIPEKLNVFYNQAFEALFERHDALKGGYARTRKTKLDIQDFAKVFSAFCLQSYDKAQLEFTQVEALSLVESSKAITGIDANKEDFLKDCLQAVCLLVEDGLKIIFSHRSFQEYFTARFISEAPPKAQEQLIRKYAARTRRDTVLSLLYEIRPDVVEEYYLLPKLNALFDSIGYTNGEITIEQFLKYAQMSHSTIEFSGKDQDDFAGLIHEKDKRDISSLASFVLKNCGSSVGWNGFKKVKEDGKYMVQKYGSDSDEGRNFVLSELNANDEFIVDLYQKGSFFSVQPLQIMLKVRTAIIEKTAQKEASLEEILRGKK